MQQTVNVQTFFLFFYVDNLPEGDGTQEEEGIEKLTTVKNLTSSIKS